VLSVAYVDFQGDGWYHLRRLDWLLANFPHSLTFDPYVGQFVPLPPLFDLLVAAIVTLAGFPEAGSRTAEVMAALAPAVMGALVAVPAFGQARLLFDEKAATWAAFLAVLLPGPFLIRSLAGVTDHHVAEVLFSSLTLFVVTRAFLRDDRWTPVAAGLSLGAYFLCWSGAPFFVSGLLAWGILEYTRAFLLGRGVPAISRALGPAAAIALALVLLFQPKSLLRYSTHVTALGLLLVVVIAAEACRRAALALRSEHRAGLVLWAAALLVAAAATQLHPRLQAAVAEARGVFFGAGAASVGETRPLLRMAGEPSLRPVFELFGTSFLGLLFVPVLAWRSLRLARPELSLVVVWSSITLLATLGRNRFGYYLVPCLALLLAWPCARLLEAAWRAKPALQAAAAAALMAILLPSAAAAWNSTLVNEGIPVAWHQALAWLRKASPEPFSDPSYYLARYPEPRLPEHRVLAWWDYGYWIVRIARRVPVANPTQASADSAGRMLTALDESETKDELAIFKVRYVVVNDEIVFRLGSPDLIGKFATMTEWGGRRIGDYVEAFFERDAAGGLQPVWVFHPAYYQSLAVHLYLFGGQPAAAAETWVLSYKIGPDRAGRLVKEITEARRFERLEEALAHSASLGKTPHAVVGRDPTRPCVPLGRRAGFRLAYETNDAERGPFGRPSVRIFERDALP
jgi:dolichyl-diphosphooligosaccharide--protein glycosyltransferase